MIPNITCNISLPLGDLVLIGRRCAAAGHRRLIEWTHTCRGIPHSSVEGGRQRRCCSRSGTGRGMRT